MYARILEALLVADSRSEAINYFRQSVVPALRRQDGFLSGRLLNNTSTNQCLVILIWESEADRERAEADGFLQTLFQHMQHYFVSQPISRQYEIDVQVVSAGLKGHHH